MLADLQSPVDFRRPLGSTADGSADDFVLAHLLSPVDSRGDEPESGPSGRLDA